MFWKREDNIKNWKIRDNLNSPPLLNFKPNSPILGLSTTQVMFFSVIFFISLLTFLIKKFWKNGEHLEKPVPGLQKQTKFSVTYPTCSKRAHFQNSSTGCTPGLVQQPAIGIKISSQSAWLTQNISKYLRKF